MMLLIFKTSSVTPDFFCVFNLILSFSTCSESFEKICTWELLGANVLDKRFISRRFGHVLLRLTPTTVSFDTFVRLLYIMPLFPY